MHIDYERLIASNKLIHSWLQRLGMEKRQCYQFVRKCKEKQFDFNSNEQDMRELEHDAEKIIYVAEIENELIQQYVPMIYAVARKFKTKVSDDLFSQSLSCIRKSIYYFNGSSSFKTFCYGGVCQAYLQVRDSITKMQKNTVFATDLEKGNKSDYRFDVGLNDGESPVNRLLYLYENLEQISVVANLNDYEKNALSLRIEECMGEQDDWIKNFNKKTGLTVSKTRVYQLFRSAAKKVRESIDSI